AGKAVDTDRRIAPPSGVDHDLTSRATEQSLHPVEDVAAQDAFVTDEVGVQATGVFLDVEKYPYEKQERWAGTPRDAAHLDPPAARGVEMEALTIRPGQHAGVSARIGDDSIQGHPGRSAQGAKFQGEDR